MWLLSLSFSLWFEIRVEFFCKRPWHFHYDWINVATAGESCSRCSSNHSFFRWNVFCSLDQGSSGKWFLRISAEHWIFHHYLEFPCFIIGYVWHLQLMISMQFSDDNFDGRTQYARNKRIQVSNKLMFQYKMFRILHEICFSIPIVKKNVVLVLIDFYNHTSYIFI